MASQLEDISTGYKRLSALHDLPFESVTEYDIDEPKRYGMKFGGAKQFVLPGCNGKKIRVRLASNTLSTLQNDFKVKIDDIRKRIDVDVNRLSRKRENGTGCILCLECVKSCPKNAL